MKIYRILLGLLAAGAKAKNHMEHECSSDDIPCIEAFMANSGGRHAAEAPVLDYDSRNLVSVGCEGKRAVLVIQNCIGTGLDDLWGKIKYIRDQMDVAYGSHTCLDMSETSPTQAELLEYDIILVEGGQEFWTTTNTWLGGGGKQTLENLANQGKSIFVNAAPEQPNDGILPFDVTLANGYYLVSDVNVSNTDLLAPYPVDTPSLHGSAFAHGVMRNYSPNFSKWISEIVDPEEPVLVGGRPPNGAGFVALGVMTPSYYHWLEGGYSNDGDPGPSNLRVNILDYLCQDRIPSTLDAPIDIKFCSNPNNFECKSNGSKSNKSSKSSKSSKGYKSEDIVPMTVFGTEDLNVNDIDLSSVKLCLADESECLNKTSLHHYDIKDRGSPTDAGASQCAMIDGVQQDYLTKDDIDDLELAWETQDVIKHLLGNCCALTNNAAGPTFIFKAQTTSTPPLDVISTPVDNPGVDQLFIQSGAGQCRLHLRA